MTAATRTGGRMLANGFSVAVQYRAAMAFWTLSGLVQVIVYLAVWQSVAEAQGGVVNGFTTSDFAGYFIVLVVVRELSYTWIPWVVANDVQAGTIASKLLLPLHPVWWYIADTIVFKLQSLLVFVPAVAALWVVFDPSLTLAPTDVLVAVPLVLLGAAVRFASDWLLGLSSLWLTKVDGLRNAYYIGVLFLGGQFVPIDLLPEQLQTLAKLLPFWWSLGFPVEVILGRHSGSEVVVGLAVQATWFAVLVVVGRAVWRRGMRTQLAVGL